MKTSLYFETAEIGLQSAFRFTKGFKERDPLEMIQGMLFTIMALLTTSLVYLLDYKSMTVGYQSAAVALSSAFCGKSGVCDIIKGRYFLGVCKLIVAVAGIIAAAQHAASLYQGQKLSDRELAFLETHQREIEQMYAQENEFVKGWERAGKGASKIVVSHPELPNKVIKIPITEGRGFRTRLTGMHDLLKNHLKGEQVRQVILNNPRYEENIVIPKSAIYVLNKGPIIIEEQVVIEPYSRKISNRRISLNDFFDTFLKETDICDVFLLINKNAGIVKDSSPPRIVLFDTDCGNFLAEVDFDATLNSSLSSKDFRKELLYMILSTSALAAAYFNTLKARYFK